MNDIRFLNVDLEVKSRWPLDGLVDALRENTDVLHHGKIDGGFLAVVELANVNGDVESILNRFCQLVEGLDTDTRAIWDESVCRTFDVGFESGTRPNRFRTTIRPQTMQKIVAINAVLAVTIYPNRSDVLNCDGTR